MTPVLLLDLDGVIVDAVQECALVTWLGVHHPQPHVPISAHVVPDGFVEHFTQVRQYARTLGHFLVAHHTTPATLRSGADFDRAWAGLDPGEVQAFVSSASAVRQRCRTEEPGWWRSRHVLYPHMAELLHRHTGAVAVITAKDTASAWSILRHHGVAAAVTTVVGDCSSKDAAVLELCRAGGVSPAAVTFLDDNLDNVRQVRATGADARWATWGYHAPEDPAVAAATGIASLDLPAAAKLTIPLGTQHDRKETP